MKKFGIIMTIISLVSEPIFEYGKECWSRHQNRKKLNSYLNDLIKVEAGFIEMPVETFIKKYESHYLAFVKKAFNINLTTIELNDLSENNEYSKLINGLSSKAKIYYLESRIREFDSCSYDEFMILFMMIDKFFNFEEEHYKYIKNKCKGFTNE